MYNYEKDENYISYINALLDNPSIELQHEAICENAGFIQYIKNPVVEVQMSAIKQNKNAIYHIKNPHPRVLIYLNML